MNVLDATYFELNAHNMLRSAGLTKAAFAEKMGVAAQNVNKTIATKNIFTLMKISNLLGVSLDMLITGTEANDNTLFHCPNCGAKLKLVKVEE